MLGMMVTLRSLFHCLPIMWSSPSIPPRHAYRIYRLEVEPVMYKDGVSVHTNLSLNTLIVKIVNEKLFPGYPTSTMSFLVMEPTLSGIQP